MVPNERALVALPHRTTSEFVDTRTNCLYTNGTSCRTWTAGSALGGGPSWKHNANLRYSMYLDNGASLWASVSGRYVGAVPVDRGTTGPNEGIRERPAYSLFNLNAGASFGDWDISAWVENAANKQAEISGQSAGISGPRVIYTTPRTVGVNLSYAFR